MSICFRKCSIELSTSTVDEKINTNRILTGSDLTMDCVKSISELEPVYAKKWTGKSLTKAGLSQNLSRQDLAWTGLYLNAYRSRVGLDWLKSPFSHTSLGRVLDKNQPGSQLEFLNHLLIVTCQYFIFLCPMCILCSVMCDVWCVMCEYDITVITLLLNIAQLKTPFLTMFIKIGPLSKVWVPVIWQKSILFRNSWPIFYVLYWGNLKRLLMSLNWL